MKRSVFRLKRFVTLAACVALVAVAPATLYADPTAVQATVQTSLNDVIQQAITEPTRVSEVPETPVELGLGTLSLQSVEGSPVKADEYQNKKVVLYFWSIRCHGCAGPIAELQAMQEEFERNDIELLTVHLFEPNKDILKSAFTQLGLRVPIMLAPNAVRDLFKVRLLPTSLVFDNNHKLQARLEGEIDEESLRLSIFGKAPAELVEQVQQAMGQ